jgi:hypothetical protein
MARQLVLLSLIMGLAVPVWAAGPHGAISGTVRDSAGVAQIGVTIEVLGSSPVPAATVFTGPTGAYMVPDLAPGRYFVRVTAPLFLPSLREGVVLKSGANIILNVTLNTLAEAVQILPSRRRSTADQDDWKWTIRSGSNPPLLRVFDQDSLVLVSRGDNEEDKVLKARIAFIAGSEGGGTGNAGDMNTAFSVESSMFSSGIFSLKGNVGYSAGSTQSGTIRASYSHKMANGDRPEFSVTMRRAAAPETMLRDDSLQSVALSAADHLTLFNRVELNVGSEYQMVQFRGRNSAFRPYASAEMHLSPETVLQYRYATSVPDTRMFQGFDSISSKDLTESGARISFANSKPVLERARHQELSVTRHYGKNSASVAWYSDHIRNLALTGTGDPGSRTGNILPDLYSGTFSFPGPNLDTSGMRLVVQRKVASNLSAAFAYSYGGVLSSEIPEPDWSDLRASVKNRREHGLTGRMSGSLPGSRTQWSASYRWTSGENLLTPVDMFDISPGQSDSYLNVFIRQPIPAPGFMAGRMEALVDVRNLLAQGYVPVVGTDGRTLYLVQSARAIRGGVAFNF